MEKNKNKLNFLPQEMLYKLAILIVSVFCIIYVLPRDSRNAMQFEENRPWPYSQLMADFDFPIYKGDARIRHEQDSIMADFSPYCRVYDSIPPLQIKQLRIRLNRVPEISYYQRTQLENKLNEIYRTGILPGDEYSSMVDDSVQFIMAYNGRNATRVPLKSVYTTKKAYETLLNIDSLHLNRIAVQQSNLSDVLVPNLAFDSERSEEVRNDLLSHISKNSGMVLAGTKIVDRGEIVTPQIYAILKSWQAEKEKRSTTDSMSYQLLIGQIIFVTLILASFLLYLTLFRKDYFQEPRKILLLFVLVIFFPIVTAFLVQHSIFNVYIIPFAMVPIIVRVFMDSRTAFMALVCTTLLSSICLKYPYEFILIQMVSGLVSIMVLRELSQRSQLIQTAFVITAVNVLFYFSMGLLHGEELSNLDASMYKYLCVNGVFLLFAYPLLYVLEKIFGFCTDVTMVELSNISNPLLQRMSETAPGTFQHSMQVSNLAAEVAKEIGAKAQLVRTGALYHDIGKLNNPAFFTENQVSGVNPHMSFNEKQSSLIIVNHISDGIKLAEKYHLPKEIKDFISTHHGKGVTKYFYIQYKNSHPEEDVDPEEFSYPGPNPQTAEQAILMMADSVEAASRSLKEYTEESISNLVEKIIDMQMQDGFFLYCPITFKDIATAKSVFKEKLKIMYHTRIAYPELKK